MRILITTSSRVCHCNPELKLHWQRLPRILQKRRKHLCLISLRYLSDYVRCYWYETQKFMISLKPKRTIILEVKKDICCKILVQVLIEIRKTSKRIIWKFFCSKSWIRQLKKRTPHLLKTITLTYTRASISIILPNVLQTSKRIHDISSFPPENGADFHEIPEYPIFGKLGSFNNRLKLNHVAAWMIFH